jgi:hypothetical protein
MSQNNTEHRIHNREHRLHNGEHRIHNGEHRLHNSVSRIFSLNNVVSSQESWQSLRLRSSNVAKSVHKPNSSIFMLGWPCSLNYINNNRHDALFIFSLLSYRTSTCFGCKSSQLSGSRIYRVIHKSLRDFRPLRYGSRDGNAEGEHVNRGRDTPSFCSILQVLDMCTLGDATGVKFW